MVNIDRMLFDHPELMALAMALMGIFFNRWSRGQPSMMRLIVRIPLFLAFTYLLFQAHQVPYMAAVPQPDALTRILGDGLRAVWWFWIAAMGSNAVREFSFRGSQFNGHRFFADICVAGIYFFAFLGLITFVFNFPIQGILVTSGAVAVVLGLALQSSLGDVFYGIVLNLGNPYREGDWIFLDNGVEGRVLEMNWRATHMLTNNKDVVIVPNSVVAKSKIINASFPSHVHGTSMEVLVAPNVFPMVVRRLLNDAIQGCTAVLVAPPPSVVIKSMSREAITIDITFFTADISQSSDAQNQVSEKVFRCLGAAGITLGSRVAALEPEALASSPAVVENVERLVAFIPIFSRLPASERAIIAASMERVVFDTGATVIERGVTSEAMYIVATGVLSCTREIDGREVELIRMSTTDHFGAGGLLSGMVTEVKLSALTPSIVYRLDKKELMRVVNASPAFAASLQREFAARQIFARNLIASHETEETVEESLAIWFANLFRRPVRQQAESEPITK